MMQEEGDKKQRRGFSDFKVEIVYLAQDGCCSRCGASLEYGFHRHHKNGDPSDNSLENLELLCPSCHRATLGGAINNYNERLRWVVASLSRLVERALEGKVAGNMAEALKDAIVLALKYERELAGLAPPESPPPSIALSRKVEELRILEDLYLHAFKVGFEYGVKAVLARSEKGEVVEG
jgi:hypothetical protein